MTALDHKIGQVGKLFCVCGRRVGICRPGAFGQLSTQSRHSLSRLSPSSEDRLQGYARDPAAPA